MANIFSKNNLPSHVAVIMDGNGRWATNQNLPRIEGHKNGVNNVEEIVSIAGKLQIPYLTLYAFSVENWNRPQEEVNALMDLLVSFLDQQIDRLIENEICLKTIGQTEGLPESVRSKLDKTINLTAKFSKQTLVLALNYGSRTEILDAVNKCLKENRKHLDSWEDFSSYLYTKDIPDPDLIIRTSGEQRVSNFLLMQSAYAEYYFSSKSWPEFTEDDFIEAIQTYKKRERRYGMTGEQLKTTNHS